MNPREKRFAAVLVVAVVAVSVAVGLFAVDAAYSYSLTARVSGIVLPDGDENLSLFTAVGWTWVLMSCHSYLPPSSQSIGPIYGWNYVMVDGINYTGLLFHHDWLTGKWSISPDPNGCSMILRAERFWPYIG